MSIGNNVNLKDRLIRKTVGNVSNISKGNITNKATTINTEEIVRPNGGNIATEGTKKATFYVKKDLLQKLYNFAYWERHNVTDAFNAVMAEGLRGKNTKNRGK